MYRAILEATAYGIRHILEALETAGSPPQRLVAVGGGTKGGLWTETVSDVAGLPQEVTAETVRAAYGDALLVAKGVGLVAPDGSWARVAETVTPEPGVRSLYPATRDQAHALAAIQRRETEPEAFRS